MCWHNQFLAIHAESAAACTKCVAWCKVHVLVCALGTNDAVMSWYTCLCLSKCLWLHLILLIDALLGGLLIQLHMHH